MDCAHHAAGRCRSCTLLGQPYADQLAAKEAHCRALLTGVPDEVWAPPVASPEAGFRNKAKMVVGGTADAPTLGILDEDRRGIDLRDCGLHSPGLEAALPVLAGFVTTAHLTPYDVRSRRGELKHLLVTESPDGELMVRFVLRSTEALSRIRKHLPELRSALPAIRVASVNLQPDHKAVLEGEQEVVLTEAAELPMRVNDVTLHLRPQGFFQTNTAIAAALYREVGAWADELGTDGAEEVLDLYCGVGGFALHCARPAGARPGRRVTGVETSREAVTAARRSAREAGLAAEFHAGDATAYARSLDRRPDLVVVNPPRRGIGPELAGWLESAAVPYVVYSSCNAASLARDLAAMPGLTPRRVRVLDMFPQTMHYEVLVLLAR